MPMPPNVPTPPRPHPQFLTNTLLDAKPAQSKGTQDHELPDGAFSSHDYSIAALQQRGVVLLSCHNAIRELAERLDGTNANPDKLLLDALAAALTNHVIPPAIVTPGAVGALPDQEAWDVAPFMDSHERPHDTRAKFHDSPDSMYGLGVNGRVLGAPRRVAAPAGPGGAVTDASDTRRCSTRCSCPS